MSRAASNDRVTTELTAALVRDEAALTALASEWDALEARALAAAPVQPLYASHRYVSLAWQHLRRPGDELAVVTLREGERLRAVWPLVRRRERALGMPVWVMSPIGIWEGERPGVLTDLDDSVTWAALWAGLLRHRGLWHGLDLREIDPGHWLLGDGLRAPGLHMVQTADHRTPYQTLAGTWPEHLARRSAAVLQGHQRQTMQWAERAPDAQAVVVTEASMIDAAFSRYLALDAAYRDPLGDRSPYLLGRDTARVAFYRELLPRLAGRGDAQLWLLQRDSGEDLAALLRLRGGSVWLERHATEHPAWRDVAPARHLLLQALARCWDGPAQESDLLWPPDDSGRAEPLGAWYDGTRATRRLRVWNLRSRLAPMRWLARWRGRQSR